MLFKDWSCQLQRERENNFMENNTYLMKRPDLYYFETEKCRHKPSQILYGEYEPQASCYLDQVILLRNY